MWSRCGALGPLGADFVYFLIGCLYYLFNLLGGQIAISLGFYKEDSSCLERFAGTFSIFLQASELRWFSVGVYMPKGSQADFGEPGAFWAFCGGLLVASSSWLVWRALFHRFDKCPNHERFSWEVYLPKFASAAKLVLVTLAPFGPSRGLSL